MVFHNDLLADEELYRAMTFDEAITSYGRTFSVELQFFGADNITVTSVVNFSISEAFSQSDTALSMGCAFSNKLEATFYRDNSNHDFRNNTVDVIVKLHDPDGGNPYPWLMGSFVVSEVSTSTDFNQISIVAYDVMAKMMNENYTPSSSIGDFEDIVNDICDKYNLAWEGNVVQHQITADEIYECTEADMLGFIAGCGGTNVGINQNGDLAFRWYTDTATVIDNAMTVENGFLQKATQDFTVNSVTAGVGDQYVTVGTGKGITFTNPYITAAELQAIYDNVNGFTYLPCEVQWFGDPRRTIGDVVIVHDRNDNLHNCLISQQNITFNGGYRSTIISAGSDATSIAFDTQSPMEKKFAEVRQSYTQLQAALVDAVDSILGANGVFEVIDENGDGVNEGWRIWNADRTQYIIATSGGIGFFNGTTNVPVSAITFDGIVANAITTGTMSAERISVDGYGLNDYFRVYNNNGTITVQIGDGANGLVLTQTGSKIAFTDTAGNDVAYWDAANSTFSMPRLNTFIIGGCAFREQTPGNLILEGA